MLNQVETTDIFRGAFFLCHGAKLTNVRIKQTNRKLVAFLIEGEEIEQLDLDYRRGKATVNPLLLRETLNELRDIIFMSTRLNPSSQSLRRTEGRMRDDRERENRGDQEER
jgi:hypothetical protein